ncbi:MAG: GntR family transcriptional regulator [bacterium]|nr:GntR family transcriptional regulator [bacterium]
MDEGLKLVFNVKPTSGVPIYRQIIDQVKRMIVSGHLKPGDRLPSVRNVATYLEVNQMTISKAYSILEATGLLERHRGRPMEVAAQREDEYNQAERLELLRPVLVDAATHAKQLALPNDVVKKEFAKILKEIK